MTPFGRELFHFQSAFGLWCFAVSATATVAAIAPTTDAVMATGFTATSLAPSSRLASLEMITNGHARYKTWSQRQYVVPGHVRFLSHREDSQMEYRFF